MTERPVPAASGEDVEQARELTRQILAWPSNPADPNQIKVHGGVVNERAPIIAAAPATARAQGRAERSKLDEAVVEAARLLASEAETVCDLFGGDKSVDALRAALSVYLDALAAPEDAG
jgi:hypothetical protein